MRCLVESSIYYDSIIEKIKKINTKAKEITITVNPQNVNNVVGYKRENIAKIKEMYDLDVEIKQDIKRPLNKIDIEVSKKYKDFIDDKETVLSKRK